jgi:hypothetical protein
MDKTQYLQNKLTINKHNEIHVKQCKLTWNKPNNHVTEKLKKIIKGTKKHIGEKAKEHEVKSQVVGLPLPPSSPYFFTLTHTQRDFAKEEESIVNL